MVFRSLKFSLYKSVSWFSPRKEANKMMSVTSARPEGFSDTIPTRRTRAARGSSASLEDVISLAAIKNSEFTRNPRRSNCLAQTLLQRRHWFHLLEMHEETTRSPTPPPVKAPPLPLKKKLCHVRQLNRKRMPEDGAAHTDGGDPATDGNSIVLVVEVNSASDEVVTKRRRRVSVVPQEPVVRTVVEGR